jgi:hypothetical protein
MDEALTPGLSRTLEGVTVIVGVVPFDEDMVADRETVPVNWPIGVKIRFEDAAAPGWTTSSLGTGLTAKSRWRGLEDEKTA